MSIWLVLVGHIEMFVEKEQSDITIDELNNAIRRFRNRKSPCAGGGYKNTRTVPWRVS